MNSGRGDTGETSLADGTRVPKDHLRIRVYGTLDETVAVLGMVVALGENSKNLSPDSTAALIRIQKELFMLGSELAEGKAPLVQNEQIRKLEEEVAEMEIVLPPLKQFILPGGNLMAATLQFARTVIRRAERELVALNRAQPVRPEVLAYVNRLGIYLFHFARLINHKAGHEEALWSADKA